MRAILLIALLLPMSACSYDRTKYADPDDGSENIVYQFIDAETMKPIQGAYVNAVWVKPTPAGKVGSAGCVRAALLRSDANGWVRMKAPKGAVLDRKDFMVPEYEYFKYIYQSPDDKHVLHVIEAERRSAIAYPAWATNLKSLGYYYDGPPNQFGWGYYKAFSIRGFTDNESDIEYPQRYFISYRSLPNTSTFGLTNVANSCGDEGENIGLSDGERAETGTRRALMHLKLLCDEKWDSAKGGLPENEIIKALWLVRAPSESVEAWKLFEKAVPSYKTAFGGAARAPFTREQRTQFCTWMAPFAEKNK